MNFSLRSSSRARLKCLRTEGAQPCIKHWSQMYITAGVSNTLTKPCGGKQNRGQYNQVHIEKEREKEL